MLHLATFIPSLHKRRAFIQMLRLAKSIPGISRWAAVNQVPYLPKFIPGLSNKKANIQVLHMAKSVQNAHRFTFLYFKCIPKGHPSIPATHPTLAVGWASRGQWHLPSCKHWQTTRENGLDNKPGDKLMTWPEGGIAINCRESTQNQGGPAPRGTTRYCRPMKTDGWNAKHLYTIWSFPYTPHNTISWICKGQQLQICSCHSTGHNHCQPPPSPLKNEGKNTVKINSRGLDHQRSKIQGPDVLKLWKSYRYQIKWWHRLQSRNASNID